MSGRCLGHQALTAVLTALALPAAGQAAPVRLDCPPTLEARPSVVAPEGWQAVTPAPGAPLERAGFYAGPPAEGASLVPDRSLSKAGESLDVWRFAPEGRDAVWLACFYRGTDAFLAKRLEPRPRQCSVRHAVLPSGLRGALERIDCE